MDQELTPTNPLTMVIKRTQDKTKTDFEAIACYYSIVVQNINNSVDVLRLFLNNVG